MANDLTEVGRNADHLVDAADEADVGHWAHRFGVTADELHAAMREAGARVGDIEAYFRKRRGPRPGM